MKLKIFMLSLVLVISTSVMASLEGKTITVTYEGDQSYFMRFQDQKVHWKGLSGADMGSETNAYKGKEIIKDVYFVQWIENNGTFVTLVLDFNKLISHSSGTGPYGDWFREGKIRD
jgi:hypothetical protein